MKSLISAILLAAGESKRMGIQNKLLLPFGDTTLLEYCLSKYLKSDVDSVIVVTGHEQEKILDVVKNFDKVEIVFNPNYQQGMTSSIQAGVSKAFNSKGYMLAFMDMPFISVDKINKIIEVFIENYEVNPYTIAVPIFNDQEGHPIVFSSKFKKEILDHNNMSGLKGIKNRYRDHIVHVLMESINFLIDIDNEDQYSTILRNITQYKDF